MKHYIGFYYHPALEDDHRKTVPAANTKMEYVAETVTAVQPEPLRIFSLCGSDRPCRGKTVCITERMQLRVLGSLGISTKLSRVVNYFYARLALLWYLLFTVGKDDTVIVYHSLYYMGVIGFAHRLRHFRFVQEVEEIYADVTGNTKTRGRELSYFKLADAYIFPTILLNNLINTRNKPYAICHGTYKVEPDRGTSLNDGRIHVIYAGTLDPRKGGAAAASAAGEYLDERYHIHILGFGSGEEKEYLLRTIDEVNRRAKCRVTYDGLKTGEDYIRFLQSCQIGLSTQNPEAAFNSTSFPSKILSYMSNGLQVVSIRIPAVETSDVGELITYYDEQTPEKIAEAIGTVKAEKIDDNRKNIIALSERFLRDISLVI